MNKVIGNNSAEHPEILDINLGSNAVTSKATLGKPVHNIHTSKIFYTTQLITDESQSCKKQ